MYLFFLPACVGLVVILAISITPIFEFRRRPLKRTADSPTFCPAEVKALEQLAALGNTERAR